MPSFDPDLEAMLALARKADRVELLLRSHIQSSQVEVRKITLHQVFLARQAVDG